MSRNRTLSCLFILMLSVNMANAEAPVQQQKRTLSVLPSTDTSNLNLGQSLQYALISLFQQTNYYAVSAGTTPMAGFTPADVARTFQATNTEVMAFAYLEQERITVFLFDAVRPREFIVIAHTLVDPMLGNQVNQQVVEYKLRAAFNDLLSNYYQNQFQPLPGSNQNSEQQVASAKASDDPKSRAEESRKLFRELAALQDSKYYVGAAIGMARFSGTGEGSASNVNFGAYGGMKQSEQWRGEFSLSFFSYTFAELGGLYRIPFAEKYLSLYASFGAGMVLGAISGPRFAEEPGLQNGGLLFGPGINVDIPLLGANIRGGLKLFFGSGSLMMGTYGLSYNI